MFEKHDTPLKIMFYSLFMLGLYVLQSVPAFGLRFMGMSPELLLALSISIAFFESETFSAFFGLASGLLNDIITNSIVGKSAIYFMFAAFFVSVLLQTLLRRMFSTYVFAVLSVTAVFLLSEYVFVLIFLNSPPVIYSLVKVILPKFLFTGVLAYPVYYIVKILHKKSTRGDEL